MEETQERDAGGIVATIVVLTHNRKDALAACLAALAKHTTVDCELIVVDNGSTDDTGGFMRRFQKLQPWANCKNFVGIWRSENEGVCARNHALRQARGEFILQVDDDVVVGPDWDTRLLSWFSDPSVGAAGQEGFFVNWAGFMAGPYAEPGFLDRRRPSPGVWCDLVMGYCWAWRNLQFDSPHADAANKWASSPERDPMFLYDERFNPHWHEETDLQFQIKAAGYRIRCGPSVAVHRSMKDWGAAHANVGPIGLNHAADHERLLIEKWGDKREALGLELDRMGAGA